MSFEWFSGLSGESDVKPGASAEEKPLVLVVDDDQRIRQGLQFNLRETYKVRLCASGEEGLNALKENVYVVILDIKMPNKNGLQVYKEIKAKFPDLPVIFYSAYQNALEAVKINKEYKPFSYVDKGGQIQELRSAIERAVQHHKKILALLDIEHRLQKIG